MIYCRNCGNTIDESITTCPICGQNPKQGNNYCPNCGQFLIPGDTVCINCHQPLVDSPKLSIVVNNDNHQPDEIPSVPDNTAIGAPEVPPALPGTDSQVPPSLPTTESHASQTLQQSGEQVPPPLTDFQPEPQPEPQLQSEPQRPKQQAQQTTFPQSGPKFLASGKSYCRNCGLVINSDAQKCPFCESPTSDGTNYCPKCGTGTTPQDTSCYVCGQKLTRIRTSYIPSQPPVKKQESQRQSSSSGSYSSTNRGSSYTSSGQPYQNVNIQNNHYYNVSKNDGVGDKNWTTTLLLCLLGIIGLNGIHRLYTGDYFIGILQLLSGGACWIWQLVDLIMILSDAYHDGDGNKLNHK